MKELLSILYIVVIVFSILFFYNTMGYEYTSLYIMSMIYFGLIVKKDKL